ncbi:hypothetical protein [Marinobacterium aestuariivivens]|uniref:Uncharacterized protein n=1 Tax=Marinobacterium aestuariivivens TaxID=1698799 RepID=A0ABW2A564_9GAMM
MSGRITVLIDGAVTFVSDLFNKTLRDDARGIDEDFDSVEEMDSWAERNIDWDDIEK